MGMGKKALSVTAAGAGRAVASAVFGALQGRPLDEQERLAPAFRTAQGQPGNFLLERAGTRRALENALFFRFFFHFFFHNRRIPLLYSELK
jgi:hypothetical protein